MTRKHLLSNLSEIKHLFEEQGFICDLQTPTELSRHEQIIVQMPGTVENNAVVLRIFWSTANEIAANEDPKFLHFFVLLPIQISEQRLKETITLVLSMNAMFDLSTFGVYEADRLIYYRYVHVCSAEGVAKEPIIAILSSIAYLLESCVPYLTEIASGHKTLETIQHEAQAVLKKHGLN